MKENSIHEIIGKVLAGEADKYENDIFQQWLSESDVNQEEFELHKSTWNKTNIKFKLAGSESVFREILNKIDDQQEENTSIQLYSEKHNTRKRFMYFARIAASILLIASVFYVFKFYFPGEHGQYTKIGVVQKHNIAGQKSKIFLPDGSVVWLNAESSISYPEKFSEDNRVVDLQGEAFFSVIKNPEQPFMVRSGNISTIVLGTTFNVKSYEDEAAMHVALQTGKVQVEIERDGTLESVFLQPGEGLTYTKADQNYIKANFDPEEILSWKDGKIVFKDADLEEIIHTLSRWYGVDFTIQNKGDAAWSYTGSFENAILDNVLRSISFTKEFTYSIHQKNVTIKFN